LVEGLCGDPKMFPKVAAKLAFEVFFQMLGAVVCNAVGQDRWERYF
jgi:hypothetical protein